MWHYFAQYYYQYIHRRSDEDWYPYIQSDSDCGYIFVIKYQVKYYGWYKVSQ